MLKRLQKKKNILYYEDTKYNNPPTGLDNIYQFIHLDNIIKNYKDQLKNYDILYKIRTDIEFEKKIFYINVNSNTIYLFRDFLFFGKSEHFIKVFENYYDDIMNYYFGKMNDYIPINLKNFLKITYPTFFDLVSLSKINI